MEAVLKAYDAKIDSKKRITIRNPKYEYYHVVEQENGVVILEPRTLIDPLTISKKTLKEMDESVDNIKKGVVSNPIKLQKVFDIRLGIPEIFNLWNELNAKIANNTANRDEKIFHKKLVKTLKLLQNNPHHNGLKTHEIAVLTKRYGMKVWQSYLENNKPAAGRIYWVYYPPGSITIIGLEPHPNDNKHSYEKITLSSTVD